MDIIDIDHITSYLARNVCHGLQSFFRVVDIINIDHITSYLACNVCPLFHIDSFSESEWCITYFPIFNVTFFRLSLPFALFIL